MRLLIVGSSTKEYALAKKIKAFYQDCDIFVACGNIHTADIAVNIDILPNEVDKIKDFALANEINLTITFDNIAIENGIVELFHESNLMIFAPGKDAARVLNHKSLSKKFMYKLRITTPRFAIVDKEASGIEYLKNSKFPVVIKDDKNNGKSVPVICNSFAQAKRVLGLKFLLENEKIIIEDYIEGREYSIYFMTDGYNAIPVCSCVPYKYSLENGGGTLTHGMGAYAPAQNLDAEIMDYIRNSIVQPALMELVRNDNPYIGILGVDVIMDSYNRIYTLGFNVGFNEPDFEAIISLLDDDFIALANAAIVGSLADEYDEVKMKPKVAMSAILASPNFYKTNLNNPIIEGLSELDDDAEIIFDKAKQNEYLEYYTTGNRNMIITVSSMTIAKARQKLYDNIQTISYRDKKYIKDIGQFRIRE